MPKNNTRRKDGLIAVQVYIGLENGKRKYKTVYGKSQKEANSKAEAIKIQLRKGIDISRASDLLEIWSERWLAIKLDSVSSNFYNVLSGKVTFINDRIGKMELQKIQITDIQDIINELAKSNPKTKKPTAKKTLIDYKCVCEQIFDLAIENRVLDFNPAKYVRVPKKAPSKQRRALTDSEQQWINETEHNAKRSAMIMMYAGLRRGELFPLRWSDIDFKDSTISVTKSAVIINGVPVVKEGGKTKNATRTIDIPSRLCDYLKTEYIKDKATPFQLVNPGTNDHMMTEAAFRRMWESYIRDLNFKYGNRIDKNGNLAKSKFNPNGVEITIPKFTPHCLRHTFATMLYLAGVDVLTAKEQLGHSDVKTTLGIYTHLDQTHKRKSMGKLNEYLENASSAQVNKPANG